MRIGNMILDTDSMTLTEINQLIGKLKEVRNRKDQAHDCRLRMKNVVEEAQERGFCYVNHYTGELFKVNDWWVYDETQEFLHGDEVEK